MSMRYLLISPPKKGIRMFIESPPIGLGYVATTLRKLGHTPEIKDCLVENWDTEKIVSHINDTRPGAIGVNVFSTALQSTKILLEEVKKLNYHPLIIVGGPHASGASEHILNYLTEADFAFKGEAEIPLIEFEEYQQGKRNLRAVTGLIYRENGNIKVNRNIEYKNIEEFGFPAWDLIDPRKYFKQVNVGDKSINVHFSRGCPFACQFCVKLGKVVRWRSLEHIWQEILMLNKDYGVERFIINDEGFTMYPDFVKKFCRHTISQGNRFRFFTATGLRLNRVDDEMLTLMKEANFERSFGVGIESAVPRVRQELMNKHLKQEELEKGLEILNRNGFKPVGNFILGFPGETKEELKQSVRWACKSKWLHGANFVPFLPLPGGEATERLFQTGELPKNFDFTKINLSVVVYAPKGMTIDELDKYRAWAVWKYNSSPRMLWHYISDWGRCKRAIVTFLRIFLPNWMLPKDWRRR